MNEIIHPPFSALIIDSNPSSAGQLSQILHQLPHKVQITCVEQITEALKLVAQHLFQIIFIDLGREELHPLQTIDTLLAEIPGVSLVALLKDEQESLSSALLERGAHDYLLKSSYSVALLKRVVRYLHHQQQNNQTLVDLAHTDALTGLANRYLFHDRINQAMIRAERNKCQVALLFIDLDHFHDVNEKLGYEAGDFLLKETASRIVNSIRRQDTVARLGSDEFAVILEGIHEAAHVMSVTRQILQAFSQPIEQINKADEAVFISMSIGIALSSEQSSDPESLIKQADIARYRAKEKGRNTFQYFTPEHNRLAEQCLKLEQTMNYTLAKIFRPKPE